MPSSTETSQVPLGTYLFDRLTQVNSLQSVFGVPGDFNLRLLEHLYNIPGLKWVGNCNELNAGYAADGYARINKFGCLITTFGVGELSALNAISGSNAEDVPVLHIVGTSSTVQKSSNATNVHHLIPGDRTWEVCQDHYLYEKLVQPFSCVVESLDDSDLDKVQAQIDTAIETVYKSNKPGYLFIPSNMSDMDITVVNSKKLDLVKADPKPELTVELASRILAKLYSENFSVLVDSRSKPFAKEVDSFIEANNLHSFATILGKSLTNESRANFHGIFAGETLSTAGTFDIIQKFDCVLHIGVNFNEINNFKNIKLSSLIKDVVEIGKDYVLVDDKLTTDISGEVVFKKMMDLLDPAKLFDNSNLALPSYEYVNDETCQDSNLSQLTLAQSLSAYLKPNDVIVCEMCSFLFTMPDVKLPPNVRFISQNFYGSIGYAIPATLGVELALRDSGDSDSRVILIQGDGSAQMTVQELSNYLTTKITPTIFLLNNSGYSVERIICGATRSYNDIQPNWKWTALFDTFGDVTGFSENVKVDNLIGLKSELIKNDDKRLKLIEVILDKMDVNERFAYICGSKK